MKGLNLNVEKEIAIIEFDQEGSKVNLLDRETLLELDRLLDVLAAKAEVKILLLTSKKEGVFIAGADIKEIEGIRTSQEAEEKAEEGKAILRKIERPGWITMAVINGACLGGGLELALACQFRTASFSEKVRLGLPETKLGVLPGFGGTFRLPKLIGLRRGLGMILSGERIAPETALRYGLLDRLFPEGRLLDDSKAFAQALLTKKTRIVKKKKKPLEIFFEDTAPGRWILFSQARKAVRRRTRGAYPAPVKAIEVIQKTYARDPAAASRVESRAFGELAVTGVSKNLIKVFHLYEEFKKFPWVSPEIKTPEIKKCAILGAGVMGGGIAHLVSDHDIPVRLKDLDYKALGSALRTARKLFDHAVEKKILNSAQRDHKLGLISPTLQYSGFENADIVIEAVAEDIPVKQKVFSELSRIVPAGTLLVSNTSSIPIERITEKVAAPQRTAGLHFFNPVHRMPLVEVIRSSQTSDATLAAVIAFARSLGKVVIVVKDVPGFLINRILLSYLNEAGFLLEEGLEMEKIDSLARDFGMPVGPLELMDEVGIDVCCKVAKILEHFYGEKMKAVPLVTELQKRGVSGKKTQKGFYVYGRAGKKPNPLVRSLVPSLRRGHVPPETALKRMLYAMVNEAARCLEEKVADRPQAVDLGMLAGTGFPPFRAGLLRYADAVGVASIVQDLGSFERTYAGSRFHPCDYLVAVGKSGRGFYGAG